MRNKRNTKSSVVQQQQPIPTPTMSCTFDSGDCDGNSETHNNSNNNSGGIFRRMKGSNNNNNITNKGSKKEHRGDDNTINSEEEEHQVVVEVSKSFSSSPEASPARNQTDNKIQQQQQRQTSGNNNNNSLTLRHTQSFNEPSKHHDDVMITTETTVIESPPRRQRQQQQQQQQLIPPSSLLHRTPRSLGSSSNNNSWSLTKNSKSKKANKNKTPSSPAFTCVSDSAGDYYDAINQVGHGIESYYNQNVSYYSSNQALEQDEDVMSNDDLSQPPYYDIKSDFVESTWKTVVEETEISTIVAGVAVLSTAVIVHPLVFLGGAVTAYWAVGVMSTAMYNNYEYFTDTSFRKLFWTDSGSCSKDTTLATETKMSIIGPSPEAISEYNKNKQNEAVATEEETKKRLEMAKEEAALIDLQSSSSSTDETSGSSIDNDEVQPQHAQKPLVLSEQPITKEPEQQPKPALEKSKRPTYEQHKEFISKEFPTLANVVVQDVEFVGLAAIEVFKVFLDDDAPYNFKEFQRKRGDIDISYGDWGEPTKLSDTNQKNPLSMHIKAQKSKHLSSSSNSHYKQQERILNFRSLTKSYFGPTYATATKSQRLTHLSKKLLVLESKTTLKDIPFCNSFFVLERWVIDSHKERTSSSSTVGDDDDDYDEDDDDDDLDYLDELDIDGNNDKRITRITVTAEVQFVSKCTFESQIRSKSYATLCDVITSWTKMAKHALEISQKERKKRLQRTNSKNSSLMKNSKPPTEIITTTSSKQSSSKSITKGKKKQQEQQLSSTKEGKTTSTTMSTAGNTSSISNKAEILVAQHEENFRQLDEQVQQQRTALASGDTNVENIEVQHFLLHCGRSCHRVVGDDDDNNNNNDKTFNNNKIEKEDGYDNKEDNFDNEANEKKIKQKQQQLMKKQESTNNRNNNTTSSKQQQQRFRSPLRLSRKKQQQQQQQQQSSPSNRKHAAESNSTSNNDSTNNNIITAPPSPGSSSSASASNNNNNSNNVSFQSSCSSTTTSTSKSSSLARSLGTSFRKKLSFVGHHHHQKKHTSTNKHNKVI